MSEPRKIAAADVKVGDTIRLLREDLWFEGTVDRIDVAMNDGVRWYTKANRCIGDSTYSVWLLDRPSRQLPTEPGSAIRASIYGDGLTTVCELGTEGRWWAAGFDGGISPEAFGDDWVELVPKEDR